MNYLELVNAVRAESGVSGPALATLGGTLSRESQRVKDWVNRAWRSIQSAHRTWLFMQATFSFDATPGTASYAAASLPVTPLTTFANWKRDSLRCWRTSVGQSDEQILPFMDWTTFRDLYQFGANATLQQRPVVFSIDPQKRLVLGPIPDVAWTISGYYYKSPQALVADTDIPAVDEEFHELVVFEAMVKYGYYEAAPDVLARARDESDKLMARLESDYLPSITMGAALA